MLNDAVAVLESDPSVVLCYPRASLVDAAGGNATRYEDRLHLMQDDPVERFLKLLTEIRLSHQNLGVMRTSAAHRTRGVGSHLGSDVNFLAELSLYGKFFEVPKYQYFRRVHHDSYSWHLGAEPHQARRYHADGVVRIPFDRLRYHAGFVRAALRSPLTIGQKERILGVLLKRIYWDGLTLSRELRREVAFLCGRGARV